MTVVLLGTFTFATVAFFGARATKRFCLPAFCEHPDLSEANSRVPERTMRYSTNANVVRAQNFSKLCLNPLIRGATTVFLGILYPANVHRKCPKGTGHRGKMNDAQTDEKL